MQIFCVCVLCFLPREVSLAFVVKLVWWWWILTFSLVCKVLNFSIKSEWEPCWLEYSWLQIPPLHYLKYVLSLPSPLQFFCWKISWWLYGCSLVCYLSFVFNILPLFLIFVNLITVCFDVFLLGFFLPGNLWASWTWLSILFPMLGTHSAVMSSNVSSDPYSLSSPSGTHIMWILVHLMFSQRYLRLSFFLFIHFSIFCFMALISTILLPGHLFTFLPHLFHYWFPLVYYLGFPGGTNGKGPVCQCRRLKDLGLSPALGRFPGGGHDNPLRYSCLENPMEKGVWRATVHRVSESDTTEVT